MLKKMQFITLKWLLITRMCESMYFYVNIFYNGDGILADKNKAVYYYKMAADKGHKKSQLIYDDINDDSCLIF